MDFVIPRDVSANQGRNKEVCYLGKFYVGSDLAFKLRNVMSAPGSREGKKVMVTDNNQGKKGYLLLNNANLHG